MKKTCTLLLLFMIIIYGCKKENQKKETRADKIEKRAYEELTGTWKLIDGLCRGGCVSLKPDLSVDNFLTLKKDRTLEYKRDKDISKGTFIFRYDVRCGDPRSDSVLLFVKTNSGGGRLPPSKDEMTLAPSIHLSNDTLTLIQPNCMVDGHGYNVYKRAVNQ